MWNSLVCGPAARLSQGLVALVAGSVALGSLAGPVRAQAVNRAEPPFCTCPNAAPNPALEPNKAPAVSVKPKFAETNARLDENDEIAALEAIRVALTEVGDGNSYVWYRRHGGLSGIVQPTVSFKDPAGRVCRHILLIMTVGAATGRAEGIACRLGDGRWQLDG
jgi:17 kDa outer membrane surface antigen